ncbi:DUF664 domain-containing protein [candidate division KSB1 bacterium]|nr:DUF664 domain-containing protein [candidate division KSB1 bacterium]
MDKSIQSIAEIFDLNTRLFLNTLDGADEAVASKRPNASTNSMLFIACHLLDARYYIGRLIGLDCECPFQEIFDKANSIEDFTEYPTLTEIQSGWQDISDKIASRIKSIKKSDLSAPAPFEVPVSDKTIFGFLSFLAQHESYHIGQLALLRKYFGLDAMKYD